MSKATILFGMVFVASIGATPVLADTDNEGYLVVHEAAARPTAPADKALVYIVRPAITGFAIKMWGFADDQLLGVTRGRNYAVAEVTPGPHVFWSKSENVNAIRMSVEAGKTYYIQQRVRPGAFRAQTLLEVLDQADGEQALGKCKYVTHTERAREKAGQYVAKHLEDAGKYASNYPQSRRGMSRHDHESAIKDNDG